MEEVVIVRIDSIPTDGAPISRDQFTTHTYPFNTLPLLESHIHPKFVIINAGIKLERFDNTVIDKLVKDFPGVSSLRTLYNLWTGRIPDTALADPSYNVTRNNDKDDDDKGEDNNGMPGKNKVRNPPPLLLIIHSAGEWDVRGGMRYATPPPVY